MQRKRRSRSGNLPLKHKKFKTKAKTLGRLGQSHTGSQDQLDTGETNQGRQDKTQKTENLQHRTRKNEQRRTEMERNK